MMDLNQVFKTVIVTINVIISIVTSLVTMLSIYVLSEHFFHNECGQLSLYVLANGIFLPVACLMFIISSCIPCCDAKDLFGINGIFLSVMTLPIYIMDIAIGSYYNFVNSDSKECLDIEYNDAFMLYYGFKILYYYSIVISLVIITVLIMRFIIVKFCIPEYKKSPYYNAHLALINQLKTDPFIKNSSDKEQAERINIMLDEFKLDESNEVSPLVINSA